MPELTIFAAAAALALSLAACGKPADQPVSAPAAAKPIDAPAAPAPAPVAAPAAPAPAGALYKVVDGKVDANTLAGWKAWRSAACERCHGPSQEGLVGPSLIESLKSLSLRRREDHGAQWPGRKRHALAPVPCRQDRRALCLSQGPLRRGDPGGPAHRHRIVRLRPRG